MPNERCGWHGSVEAFLSENKEALLSELYARYPAGILQEAAWSTTLEELGTFFEAYVGEHPGARSWWLVLEYQMPRARDRPIDVCLLTQKEVVAVEVKDTRTASAAARDQLRGYLRDLEAYHEASRQRSIVGMLMVTGASQTERRNGTIAGNIDALGEVLAELEGGPVSSREAESWIQSAYDPLPSLVDAALRIFEDEPLPQIRTVEQADLEETVEYVLDTAEQGRRDGTNHLILLTGVPGAGKTLVGLQSTYQFTRDHRPSTRGLFLSGNAPLIEVLQYQLDSDVLVQDIHEFLSEYATSEEIPDEHLYVFDEAQRAWDQDYVVIVNKKKKRDLPPASEPEMLLDVLGRRGQGACLVAIVGEGQSIHKGEQSGFELWSSAVKEASSSWEVHVSPTTLDEFEGTPDRVEPRLHLDQTVRAHQATMLSQWIEASLDQRTEDALEHADRLRASGFWMRLTRDLDTAKTHVKDVYGEDRSKTYGMIGSSKANNLSDYGVDLSYVGAHWLRPGQVGPWYIDKEGQPAKCRQLVQAAQEFQCQGLELDGTLVLWGRDLSLQDGEWVTRTKVVPGIRDPHQLRLNAYRILLSRARDGMVIFVTPEESMDETAAHLTNCGLARLD